MNPAQPSNNFLYDSNLGPPWPQVLALLPSMIYKEHRVCKGPQAPHNEPNNISFLFHSHILQFKRAEIFYRIIYHAIQNIHIDTFVATAKTHT